MYERISASESVPHADPRVLACGEKMASICCPSNARHRTVVSPSFTDERLSSVGCGRSRERRENTGWIIHIKRCESGMVPAAPNIKDDHAIVLRR